MKNQITLAQVNEYMYAEDRRTVSDNKLVKAFEEDTPVKLDVLILDVLGNVDTMPVTHEQLLAVEALPVGFTTKFSVFNVTRIS